MSRLPLLIGAFALAIGLLLRRAADRRDQSDWDPSVTFFLDAFPLLLIAGGAIALLVGVITTVRARRAPEPSAD